MKSAVVMGGSMAGLLAARVLADHFDRVSIVERDRFPHVGEQRRGVPQGRHTHGLLASGRQVLDRHFPGFTEEILGAGAVTGDLAGDSRWFHEGGCLSQFNSGLSGIMASRPLIEGVIRRRVLGLRNVTAMEESDVEGLVTNGDRSRVIGIRLKQSGLLEADLVVDATGRGSKSPEWLQTMGYAKAEEERVQIALGYATRHFRRKPQDLNGNVAVVIPPTPHGKRGGVMVAQEGGTWIVTLIAHFGDYAPMDLDGFREFARDLPSDCIHEVICKAEPVGEPATARYPASARRRYENLARFPQGYLVFGDAICSFNPIYGQGMSVAALESVALAEVLAEGGADLARRFFARAAKVVDIPWSIAVGNDLRMPETVGSRSAGVRFINWYMSKLHKAAHTDNEVALAFHKVANLLAPPPSVLHPRIAARVLMGNLRTPARRKPDAADVSAALPLNRD